MGSCHIQSLWYVCVLILRQHHETIYLLIIILFTEQFLLKKTTKLEAVGQLVKTTYYFENGKVQQEGFFKMENLTELVSYDEWK
jgi:hypothetical protein